MKKLGFSDEAAARLTALRRDLHRNPELSWKEEKTAARLEAELKSLGATDIRRVVGTGVVGRIPGRSKGRTVAIRGDIDALPIEEATGLDFASSNKGVMHACGHDVHATWAIGAAMLLASAPADGDVLVLLQPAEEMGEGAAAVIASGALDGVDAIVGGHVDRRYEVGQVVAQEGPLAASTDNFTIELTGQGAHAARPHEAADPIVGAAALITALQTLVSRRLDPAVPGVVTVGTVHAGTADNIIPSRAELTGTIRAVTRASRDLLVEELQADQRPGGAGLSAGGAGDLRYRDAAGGEPCGAGRLGQGGGASGAGREGIGAAGGQQHGGRGLRLLSGADAGLFSPDRRPGAGRSLAAGALTRVHA